MVAIISVLLGILATFAVQRFGLSHHLEEQPIFYALGAVGYFLTGASLKLICSAARWRSIPFVLLGIALGVFADAAYDFYVNHIDQNLWPVGIIVWWVIGIIPIAAGFALGGAIRSGGA
jgi:hypothetical protein